MKPFSFVNFPLTASPFQFSAVFFLSIFYYPPFQDEHIYMQNLDTWKIANNSSTWTPFMHFENFIVVYF